MEDIFKDSNTVITPELNDFYSNSFLVKGNPADENVLPAPQVGGDNDDKANVRSLINKLNNISDLSKNNISNLQATYTDPLKDAKMFAFNPTYKGLNWDRYKSHSAFNELGFDPFRDNEKFYNDNTSIYSDITRGIQGFGKITASAFMNTAADLPRLLTGNWDPNTEAAKETERIMAETMSTRGTFGSSVINFGINAGFTVGIIGELIAEEMILGLAGLAGAPETGGASLGAAGYLMAVRAGLAGSKIAGLGKTTGALLKTIKNLDNAVDAKKYFNQFGRGAAEFLNPLQATTDLAKNFKNLNGLGQTARAAKSFGAFFKDIRDINRSFSEAKLEGGFVQNAMFEKLLNEAYANGKTPTPEEIDKIKEASLHAGYVNQMVNFPVIHYTNNIAFGNLVKPLNRLIGSTEDSIKILNKTITADITRKKVFQELAGGWKESLKRGFNPKLMAKNSLNYFSANLAEGLQESFQEASAIAIEDYYTKQFINENSIVRNQYELSILDSYGKGIGEQFSAQGAETFLSGFLMGGLMGRGGKIARKIGTGLNESSNKVKDLFYSKTDPEKYKEIKEKREIAKAEKEAKIKKYDEFRTNLINSLNDFYEDAGKMFSRDLAHMSAQEILDAKAKQAQETGDDKFLIDFTDASLFESVSNALYFGKFDLYLEHLDKIKSLDDQGLMEAMGIDDAQAGRQRLEVSIERAKEIKSRSKKFSENPYKYNDYKEGTDEYNEMVLMHNAFEDAKQSAIFTPYQFDRVLSRMNSIAESFSSIDLVANGNATEFLHLFGVDNILNEVEILDNEIQSLKDGTRENEALARRKEKQIKDLAEVRDAIIAHRAYFKALKETDTVDTSYEKNLKNAFIKYLGSYGENKSRILKSDKLDDAFKLFHDYYRLNIDAEYLSKSVAIVADPDFLRQESLRRYNALKKQYTNRKELIKKKWDTYLRKIGLNGVFQKLYEAGFAGDPEQMVAYNLSGGKTPVNLFYRISDFSRVTAADVEDIKKIKEIFDEYEDITGITKAKEEAAKKAAEAAAKKLEEEAEAARVAAKEKALDIYTPETKAKLVADYENYPEKDTESFEEYLETPRAAVIIYKEKQKEQQLTPAELLGQFISGLATDQGLKIIEASLLKSGKFIISNISRATSEQRQKIDSDIEKLRNKYTEKNIVTRIENGNLIIEVDIRPTPININEPTPKTFQELKSEIERLRAEEETKYAAMSDPNDAVARAKIYEEYNVLITPLIKEAEADIKARKEKDINSISTDPIKEPSEYNAYISKINDIYNAELESLKKKETPQTKVQSSTIEGQVGTSNYTVEEGLIFYENEDGSRRPVANPDGRPILDVIKSDIENRRNEELTKYDEGKLTNTEIKVNNYKAYIHSTPTNVILKIGDRYGEIIFEGSGIYGYNLEKLINAETGNTIEQQHNGRDVIQSKYNEELTALESEQPKKEEPEVKEAFPLSPQFEGKIIYFSPGLGKTTLVNQYPDQFVDMDVLLYEEFKDEPGFEDATPETFGTAISAIYKNLKITGQPAEAFNVIKNKLYDNAFKKAKELTKQGKTVLTGSGAFISKADFSVKANDEKISKEQLLNKNPNMDEIDLSEALSGIRRNENRNNILLSVDKDSFIQFLMGNYDILKYINEDITFKQLDELGKFMMAPLSPEVMEAFSKKMEYFQARELLFSSLQPGDTVIIYNEKTGKNYTTKIMNKKDANSYNLEIVPDGSSYLMRSNLPNLINVIPTQGTSEGIKIDEVDNSDAEDNKTKVNDVATETERLKALLNESFNDDDLFEDAEDPNNCKIKK